jgi:hypothetical protein
MGTSTDGDGTRSTKREGGYRGGQFLGDLIDTEMASWVLCGEAKPGPRSFWDILDFIRTRFCDEGVVSSARALGILVNEYIDRSHRLKRRRVAEKSETWVDF